MLGYVKLRGKWHVENDPSSHPVAVRLAVSYFYCHASLCSVTKPSRKVPKLSYEGKGGAEVSASTCLTPRTKAVTL